jgi:hypothetical protein
MVEGTHVPYVHHYRPLQCEAVQSFFPMRDSIWSPRLSYFLSMQERKTHCAHALSRKPAMHNTPHHNNTESPPKKTSARLAGPERSFRPGHAATERVVVGEGVGVLPMLHTERQLRLLSGQYLQEASSELTAPSLFRFRVSCTGCRV